MKNNRMKSSGKTVAGDAFQPLESRRRHVSLMQASFFAACVILYMGCAEPERVWNLEDGYRWADLHVRGGEPGFEMLSAAKTGITFVNQVTEEQIVENRHRMHGSGVALGDVDGDGQTDIYFTRLDGDNVLYRNLGAWKFADITAEAGVAAPGRFSTGAVLADIDGDADLDLLVTALGGPNAAFLNDGSGHFEEITESAGLAAFSGSTTMALADVEGDGDLDLYVANYKRIAMRDSLHPTEVVWENVVQETDDGYRINPKLADHYTLKEWDTKLIKLELAESDRLYLNNGSGHFTDAMVEGGMFYDEAGQPLEQLPEDWALVARFQDLNGDGSPDLYVCNDFESPDHIWLNQKGTFHPLDPLSLRKTSNATMSVAFSDVNRDGQLDFFLADMLSQDYSRRQSQRGTQIPLPLRIGEIEDRPQVMQNTLFVNRGDLTYAEVANMYEAQASDWTWSSVFLDVDLDGYEDLLHATGHAYDVQNLDAQSVERHKATRVRDVLEMRSLFLEFPKLLLPNAAFRNEGGLGFSAQPAGWGLGEEPDISHGMALADFDDDGDLDVVINRLNTTAGVYENTGRAPRVAVRLKGAGGNTQGIGAKIRLLNGPVAIQEHEVISGGQYLSGSDPLYSFAAGDGAGSLTIEVEWRSGEFSTINDVQGNRIYEIEEATSEQRQSVGTTQAEPAMFEEVAVEHNHDETVFDDFARQPLLPRRFSQMGPAVVWADADRDGDDDLLIGSGRGGRMSYFRNDSGQLAAQSIGVAGSEAALDQLGIIVVPVLDKTHVLVAQSNYEAEQPGASSMVDVYEVTGRSWQRIQQLDIGLASIGPMASADVDGDGDLDVFVGGSMQPGNYPEPVSSHIIISNGAYVVDAERSQVFERVGMVRGAVFGDIDADGDQDLALALEWGGVKLFANDGAGQFEDVSASWGLEEATGMWQGVEMGDFDADGRLDLAATNWGWNSHFGRPEYALRQFWGDYDGNGSMDVLEAHYEPAMQGYVPEVGLNLLWYSMPFLRRRIVLFKTFSEMTIDQVIGPNIQNGQMAEIRHLAHHVFFNRGDRFEARALPMLSQVAPGFGVAVGDYNADGAEDVFMAQNFFAERLEVPRNDAGRGLWLKGGGDGSFELAEGTVTGIKVYGEQRGVGLADYDQDGRLDVAVSQNGREVKLYRNVTAPAGVRVRLQGNEYNPWGIGSQVRLRFTDGTSGAVRNIAAGSGYLSQQSMVQVMGVPAGKTVQEVHVVWPDGKEQVVKALEETGAVTVQWE